MISHDYAMDRGREAQDMRLEILSARPVIISEDLYS